MAFACKDCGKTVPLAIKVVVNGVKEVIDFTLHKVPADITLHDVGQAILSGQLDARDASSSCLLKLNKASTTFKYQVGIEDCKILYNKLNFTNTTSTPLSFMLII